MPWPLRCGQSVYMFWPSESNMNPSQNCRTVPSHSMAFFPPVHCTLTHFRHPFIIKDSIQCGFHLVPYIARTVFDTLPASAYVLITVSDPHYTSSQNFKSHEGKAAIEDFLLLNTCTHDTVVLTLGGGVIGDLVGRHSCTVCTLCRYRQLS
ncbi:hypothetical protein EDB89DRAFT_1136980 [Lactarius sanguifluus]|nr:hypothetical protein EDB89DRAFT_1136980 [Lactarius sanguifluus]